MLPKKVGDIPARGPNCKGDNVSPQLAWSNPPEGTRSYAFIVFDPTRALGRASSTGSPTAIAPDVTSFAEGEISRPSDKYVGGKSGKKLPFFGGPCPPPGSPHHYLFQIVATDLDPKELPPGLTFAELQREAERPPKGRIEPRRNLRQSLSVRRAADRLAPQDRDPRIAVESARRRARARRARRSAALAASSTTQSASGSSQPPSTSDGERRAGEVLSVGRIEEGERERAAGRRGAEPGRVRPPDAGDPAERQRLDIGAQERARFRPVVDEQGEARPARQRLDRRAPPSRRRGRPPARPSTRPG